MSAATSITFNDSAGVLSTASGQYHQCALFVGGGVRCWGRGSSGALGHGSDQNVGDSPLRPMSLLGYITFGVTMTDRATEVAVGPAAFHSCAIFTGGKMSCWGLNTHGQLGLGNGFIASQIGSAQTDMRALEYCSFFQPSLVVAHVAVGGAHTCTSFF